MIGIYYPVQSVEYNLVHRHVSQRQADSIRNRMKFTSVKDPSTELIATACLSISVPTFTTTLPAHFMPTMHIFFSDQKYTYEDSMTSTELPYQNDAIDFATSKAPATGKLRHWLDGITAQISDERMVDSFDF